MPTQAFEVIRGTAEISAASTTTTITESTDYTLPSGADSTNCFIRITNTRKTGMGNNAAGGSQNVADYTVTITNPSNIATSITFERDSNSNSCHISYEIICYVGSASGDNEFIVRDTGVVSGTAAQLTGTTITTISDNSDCVVFITGQRSNIDARGDWHYALWEGSLVANASDWDPQFDRDSTATAQTNEVSYAVVEFTGSNWTVDRVSFTSTVTAWAVSNNTSGTVAHGVTISDINKAGIIEMQYSTSNDATGLDDAGDAFYLEDATNIRLWNRSTAGTRTKVAWILQNSQNDGTARNMLVQHMEFRDDTTSGAEPRGWTETISTGADSGSGAALTAPLDESSIVASQSVDGGGTAYPRGATDYRLTGTDEITFRESDNGQERRTAVEIFEWPEDPDAASKTANGTPSIAAVTTTNTVDLTRPANGTPTISGVTNTGTVTVTSAAVTASGTPSIAAVTNTGNAFIWPRVYLNATESKSGADTMTVTDANAAGTSITFTDPAGGQKGNLFLGVENQGNDEIGWIAVKVSLVEADGTPTLSAVTCSGTATIGAAKLANGTPSLAAITTANTVDLTHPATGTPSIAAVTTANTVTLTHPVTGTPSIATIEVAGTAVNIVPATGAPELAAVTTVGSALTTYTADGSPSIAEIDTTGTATVTYQASGTPSLPDVTVSATVTTTYQASGAVSVGVITTTNTVDLTHPATGTPSLAAVTNTATIQLTRDVTGTPSIAAITNTGLATVGGDIVSSGTPAIAGPTSTGDVILGPKVYLNTTQTLVGATEMTVTAWSATSITFSDPVGPPTGSLFLGVENRNNDNVGWIAVTVLTTQDASGTPVLQAVTTTNTVDLTHIMTGTPAIAAVDTSGTASVGAATRTVTGTPQLALITVDGVVVGPPAAEVEEEAPTGGYGARNYYAAYRQRKRRKKRELDKLLAEIPDTVDREIAELLHDETEAQLAELEQLVQQTYSEREMAEMRQYSERLATAYNRAYVQGNYSALMAFEREMERAIEEEEFLLLALMSLG